MASCATRPARSSSCLTLSQSGIVSSCVECGRSYAPSGPEVTPRGGRTARGPSERCSRGPRRSIDGSGVGRRELDALRRLGRVDADLLATLVLVLEGHHAVDEGVDRVVAPEADVLARVPLRAALADDD